jgi:hypothetical protein
MRARQRGQIQHPVKGVWGPPKATYEGVGDVLVGYKELLEGDHRAALRIPPRLPLVILECPDGRREAVCVTAGNVSHA